MYVRLSFRNMKVTLKCNHDIPEPDFTAQGELVQLEYVSPVLHCFVIATSLLSLYW